MFRIACTTTIAQYIFTWEVQKACKNLETLVLHQEGGFLVNYAVVSEPRVAVLTFWYLSQDFMVAAIFSDVRIYT